MPNPELDIREALAGSGELLELVALALPGGEK